MTKKILFAAGLSSVIFLAAGQALAAAYSNPAQAAAAQQGSGTVTIQSGQPVTSGTMMGSPSGTQFWQSAAQAYPAGQTNMFYRTMPGQTFGANMMPAYYNGGAALWLGLSSVITLALVWIVLIQLIFVLAHWLKKHKHN